MELSFTFEMAMSQQKLYTSFWSLLCASKISFSQKNVAKEVSFVVVNRPEKKYISSYYVQIVGNNKMDSIFSMIFFRSLFMLDWIKFASGHTQ